MRPTTRKKTLPLLVQLFNGRRQTDIVEQPAPDSVPNHHREQRALEATGLTVETILAYDRPLNPAARMHNAYLGLDPLRALRILLTRRKAALIVAHLESGLIILLLRRLFRFKPPVVIWELPWSPGWKYREFVSRLAIPRADCSVVFSSSQLSLVRDAYGETARTAFLPFCIDVEFYRPQPQPNSSAPFILSCGLDAGRDFDVLLRAVRDIEAPVTIKAGKSLTVDPSAYPNVTLRTDFLSHRDFRALYAGASMVVVTTKDTPNACGVTSLLEGMAMGKPVIVSDNPALRDYLPPPDIGIVVPVGDSDALKAAILELLSNPEKAAEMGRKARLHAEALYHPRVHFNAMADLFWPIIEAAGTGKRPALSPAID